ncbi:NACHT domain-containing protein [Snodgrassella communis]|uniref:NACHT domain-containing protein n=1 Tax=Snodgrassella communis TaxID=2946699 RepID=UPI001EF6FB8B|nr:ATP-binding protein [Snodgrassella communis]
MLNFTKINAFEQGQRESFEELICLLAKRQRPKDAVDFRRIEGKGGDGGVEAFWILNDGSKLGYQAKYFIQLASSQWKQIDKSVAQALRVHPELTTYIIALPINLTNITNTSKRGQSAWEKWEGKVKEWTAKAKAKGITIKFELWSATDIHDMLSRDENLDLRRLWFGERVLDAIWFKKHFETAKSVLDDRYSPSEHVPTEIEAMFDVMVRGPSIMSQIRQCYSELEKHQFSFTDFTDYSLKPSQLEIDNVKQALISLLNTEQIFSPDFNSQWKLNEVTSALENYTKTLEPLRELVHKIGLILKTSNGNASNGNASNGNASNGNASNGNASNGNERLKLLRERIDNANSAIFKLKSLINRNSKKLQAESARWAIITGPAGSGKSHLLAHIAEQRLSVNAPTVLLVGQSFSDTDVWQQIGAMLNIPERTYGEVLGLLSAAAERQNKRALILIDAINEGVGANFWFNRVAALLDHAKDYPNLAFVFSCRKAYLNFALPKSIIQNGSIFTIKGFTTIQEMEAAAKKYLDSKGIARPNTVWLSPEFQNPLFLKSICDALATKGSVEFPKGLNGISQLMAFYLDSLSIRTGLQNVDFDCLASTIKRTVCLLAERMVDTRQDFLELAEANRIIDKAFAAFPKPVDMTWLNVLIRTSVLRRDPPPVSDNLNPLKSPEDCIRFSFQRFQDYLMAQAVVDRLEADKLSTTFETGGELLFLFRENEVQKGFLNQYAGLLEALSTLYPEMFGVEFVDTLPQEVNLWTNNGILQRAYGESCKWRCLEAFTVRSLELFNELDECYVDKLGLLIEISMTINHPWNALSLHDWLFNQAMPERDSYWTSWVNNANSEENNQIERLIDWANGITNADSQHLELAGLVIAWLLTSSHRTTRDQATKALTSIFLRQSNIFLFIIKKLAKCNDPYLLERIYAAAFGACCIDQSRERLTTYSDMVWLTVFSHGETPVALLTRDYALGIIELAKARDCLNNNVALRECLPPYKSALPEFNLTSESIEKLAEERGSKAIYFSASNEWGDFGKYTIPSVVNNFLTTPLKEPAPLSANQAKKKFLEEVIFSNAERTKAFKTYETKLSETTPRFSKFEKGKNFSLEEIFSSNTEEIIAFDTYETKLSETTPSLSKFEKGKNFSDEKLKKLESETTAARVNFEKLLSEAEKLRFIKDYIDADKNYSQDRMDEQQCRLWITKRAYELGWSQTSFPKDEFISHYSRFEHDQERIGKKYQWIALDELAARLSDNFWYAERWSDTLPSVYRYSDQIGLRNIEPTILPSRSRFVAQLDANENWMFEPLIQLPVVSEEELRTWPFAKDPTMDLVNKLQRVDKDGKKWRLLYESNGERQKYPEDALNLVQHSLRYEEFRLIFCVFVKSNDVKRFVADIEKERKLDGGYFDPRNYTNSSFLLEAPWRDTWKSAKFSEQLLPFSETAFSIPVIDYYWESTDKTLPNGFKVLMPQKWLAEDLNIHPSEFSIWSWVDTDNNELIKVAYPTQDRSAILICEETLKKYCIKEGVTPIWLLIGERNTWPMGDNNQSCWRRSEGAWWQINEKWDKISWNYDTQR